MKRKTKNPAFFPARTLRSTFGAALVFLFSGLQFLPGQSVPTPEYQVKAVFLYNFTQFIHWPASAFHQADAPFVIGILGQDPFGSYLDETVSGEKVMGHPLVVQRYRDARDIKNCHILFINSGDPERMKEILSSVLNHSILTVSDDADFARLGGMIRFFTKNNKIRFQINSSAAKTVKLDISSKLLRVAEIFDPTNP